MDDARKFGDTITNQITAENNGNERKSMESQAFYTEGKADELRDQAGIEETIAEAGTGRKAEAIYIADLEKQVMEKVQNN